MRSKFSRVFATLFIAIAIQGCATVTPPPQIDMSGYSKPTAGMSGVYFYRWKTGIYGAISDVKFVIDGKTLAQVNTGEWTYLEVPTGKHSYRFVGGLLPTDLVHQFDEGQNYFFRGNLLQLTDHVYRVNNKIEIEETVINMNTQRYKKVVAGGVAPSVK